MLFPLVLIVSLLLFTRILWVVTCIISFFLPQVVAAMACSSTGEGSSSSSSMSQTQIAQRTWEMANNMEVVNSADEIYQYDGKQQQDILQVKPWDKE